MTLHDLATAASVSVSMLSAVERGEKAPTVVVLSRIADGLGSPLPRLVTATEQDRVVPHRASDHDHLHEAGGWHREILTPRIPGINFDWVRFTLPPGCDTGELPASPPGSHGFVLVESGTLTLTTGGRSLTLETGDSAYFASDDAHDYANQEAVDCVYLVATLNTRPHHPGPRRNGHLD